MVWSVNGGGSAEGQRHRKGWWRLALLPDRRKEDMCCVWLCQLQGRAGEQEDRPGQHCDRQAVTGLWPVLGGEQGANTTCKGNCDA